MSKLQNFKYLFFLVLPIIAVAVWYSPVLFKGYPASPMQAQIILGKNIAKTGMYALENDLNVFLSSGLIKEQAHPSFLGNKLTASLYALVFKLFGFLSWNRLILLSAVLNALALLFFSFLVFYLFDFKTSLFFSLIYIFSPFVWTQTHWVGAYEFALVFISLFFFFYFLGSKIKYSFIFFILAGSFLTLAGLARDSFFLMALLFLFYLLWLRKKREIFLIFLPFLVILAFTFLPDFFAGRNTYSKLFPAAETSDTLKANDYFNYIELYPDPYTYHFDRENFLKEYKNNLKSQSLVPSVALEKSLVNMGVASMSFGRRILLSFLLMINQVGAFVSWEVVGGPFIFLLMLLGFYHLRKNRPPLFWLFISLISGVVFLTSFVFLVGRSRFVDFGWILAFSAALGLLSIINIFEERFKPEKRNFILAGFILVMVLYSLIMATHTYWGRVYDNKDNLTVLNYASEINKSGISDRAVIAVGSGGIFNALGLNYLTDKSTVVFQQRTIKKILEDGKLSQAFKNFGITHIIGYPDDLSKKIMKAASVINIASGGAGADIQESPTPWNVKDWLMNFIK